MTRLALLTPPFIKPCEPGLSAPAAAAWFRARGVDAFALDASLGWMNQALAPEAQAQALTHAGSASPGTRRAFQLALQDAGRPSPLRLPETYRDRRVYSSAISRLTTTLKLAAQPYPGTILRIGEVGSERLRPQASSDLEQAAQEPGPFDAYYTEHLIPELKRRGTTHVGLSLSFLHQALATWRLAHLLERDFPEAQRWLGGPLVACWKAAGAPLDRPAFGTFHRVLAADTDGEMDALALELGGHPTGERPMLAPDLLDTPWEGYLAPQPIVPAALGRGCYWRRCTFCPDHLHPSYGPCGKDTLSEWLEAVANRFPDGAMLHFTDSACPPNLLDRVSQTIQKGNLPLRWHGFVRMEARFADPAFTRHLAEGGCAMLQWGLETASTRMLDLLDKGVDPEQARAVLRSASGAGLRSHAYLLFGLPGETDADRQATLDFVREEARHFHDLNLSLLNLPRQSPMHRDAARYGITELRPFGQEADLSLYDDFRCGTSHPRLEARRWIGQVFSKDPAVKALLGDLNNPFKSNHGCFL